jgi:RNA polymerase sigma-70 factor, ECF subfamily
MTHANATSPTPEAMDPRRGAGELEALMARYVGGDMAAFDALYACVARGLHAYLLSMCRRRADADDLLQTTFVKIHRGRAGWIPGSPVMPWAMAIARNALIDHVRRDSGATALRLTRTGELPEPASDDDALHELIGRERNGHVTLAVSQAIASLLPSQREALLLTKCSGLTTRETAQRLGTSPTAVKLRVHRAYLALRETLAWLHDA